MSRLINFQVSGSDTIDKDLSDSFTSWESDVLNTSGDNKIGILTMQFNCTTAASAKVKIMQSLDGVNFDYVSDNNGNVVEIALNASTTVVNVVNLYSSAVKIVGSVAGTGTLNSIKALLK